MSGIDLAHQMRQRLPGKETFMSWESITLNNDGLYSAVLVPLIADNTGLKILFIERPVFMKRHAGQIAFPGGVMEPCDAGPVETALREANEELGLEIDLVDPLYVMPPEKAVTSGFVVYPVVGFVSIDADPHLLHPDPNEVNDIIFLDPFNLPFQPFEKQFILDGMTYSFTEFPLGSEKRIWGVSGRIFSSLIRDIAFMKEVD